MAKVIASETIEGRMVACGDFSERGEFFGVDVMDYSDKWREHGDCRVVVTVQVFEKESA